LSLGRPGFEAVQAASDSVCGGELRLLSRERGV
jgi:hypothetical protein